MLELTIQDHRSVDRPFIRRMLEVAALTTYADLATFGRISLRERLDEIFDHHYGADGMRIWIAWSPDGAPLGLVWLQRSMHPVTLKPEFLVLNLAVVEAQRGHGVGRRLMERARAHAEESGVRRLRLFVAAENVGAVALYEKLGFEPRTREMVWQF